MLTLPVRGWLFIVNLAYTTSCNFCLDDETLYKCCQWGRALYLIKIRLFPNICLFRHKWTWYFSSVQWELLVQPWDIYSACNMRITFSMWYCDVLSSPCILHWLWLILLCSYLNRYIVCFFVEPSCQPSLNIVMTLIRNWATLWKFIIYLFSYLRRAVFFRSIKMLHYANL